MAIEYIQRPFAVTTSNSTTATLTEESGTTSDDRVVVVHTATDDGAGNIFGDLGTVDYAGKSASLRVVRFDRSATSYKADHENAREFENAIADGGASSSGSTLKGGAYGTASVGEELFAGATLVARYRVAPAAAVAKTMTFTPPAITFDLCPYTSDSIVPGSVQFTWMGETYTDFEGVIYRGRTDSDPGTASGTLNYATGHALMTDYVVAPGAFSLQSLWTRRAAWQTASIFFRTQAAPIKPTGFVLNLVDTQGNDLSAIGDLDGNFTGTHMRGKLDYQYGVGELQFGDYVLDSGLTDAQKAEWWYDAADVGTVQAGKIWRPWPVDPTTLRYNSVTYFYLPIDAEILGLDPVRLPQDGRTPIYRVGRYIVVLHTGTVTPGTLSNGQTVSAGRSRLSRMRVVGSDGVVIHTGYTTDLDAGTLTTVDVSAWVQPVTVEHSIEQLARVRDVQINGDVGIVGQLSHDYPEGSIVASAIAVPGNLRARVAAMWDQYTWDGTTWADSLVGDAATGTYNDALAPVELTNAGALTEKFALRFTNSTSFQCIGEHVGLIGTGDINTDFAPINPISGDPYFTLRALGWGSGWAAGNVLFLHFAGAIYAFAEIRTVQMGPAAGTDYSYEVLGRGDVDRPPTP